ncbi:methyltransferase domain-containing protein [Streptomyces sp. 549]|uniref:methyltransferase domain-containing protein n=1 Tax=Streptomyces sp. 549 TaxID=3049076 RepID=UPI0024C37320|nr:methyltransferase domain-containing protein [Streptomyces sp. 549]MDK1474445.1 methyltransferase domain-containing protein [Streptomyces sp. 549]
MRRDAFLRELVAAGALPDPAWRAAFAEVPRETFVPYYFVPTRTAYERRWREDPDPEARRRWLDGAYEDVPLATRRRDGELISSSSQPSLMAGMLHALDVEDGMSVLEIGTGTGWNAALLSHRLGDDRVTTVDLDPDITEPARRHLAEAGYRPVVVTGDGARGCRSRAPFDRIIATCAISSVPRAWVEQCVPGAVVLAPLATGLIRLRVADGVRAEGRFLGTPAFFVPLRGTPRQDEAPQQPAPAGRVPEEALRYDSFRFLLELAAGHQDPWDAYALWRREDRPARTRYGVTVGPDGQWAWLDDPGGPHRWPLPGAW